MKSSAIDNKEKNIKDENKSSNSATTDNTKNTKNATNDTQEHPATNDSLPLKKENDFFTDFKKMFHTDKFPLNSYYIVIIAVALILYYLLFASLGTSQTFDPYGHPQKKPFAFLEMLLWCLFVSLLLLNGIYYFFGINVIDLIKSLFKYEKETPLPASAPTPIVSEVPIEPTKIEEVFHVGTNKYTYNDSKEICKAYDSRLATYKEIEDAYNKGANWCAYGWSEGQEAYFPTQSDIFDKLQKIKGHEHDCGRPGVNGGFIANPNVKFGVNCFGYKPEMTKTDYDDMTNSTLFPKTQAEADFDKNVNEWKKKLSELLVAPFNNNKWSII
jgi:hypothetical protein